MTDLNNIRQTILDEIHGDAKVISKQLFGEVTADTHTVRRSDYLRYVRTMWDEPGFRPKLRVRIGDEAFIGLAAEVNGYPRPKIDERGRVEWRDNLEGLPPSSTSDMLEVMDG